LTVAVARCVGICALLLLPSLRLGTLPWAHLGCAGRVLSVTVAVGVGALGLMPVLRLGALPWARLGCVCRVLSVAVANVGLRPVVMLPWL